LGGKLATKKTNYKKQTEIDLAVYKTMLDNIRDPFVVCQDGLIKYVNSRMLEMLIYDTELDLLNKGLDFIIHPEDSPAVLSNHKRRLRGEQFGTVYEFRVIRKDGEVVPVEIRVNVIEWEGMPATLNFLLDISERKIIEQTLRESENTYRTIFENTGTAMAIANENKHALLVNDEMCQLTGYTREELLDSNTDWSSFIAPHERERLINYHKMRLINPDTVSRHYEYQIVTKSGEFKDIYITSQLIRQTKKSLVSMIDITDRKKAEAASRKSSELLQELFRNSRDIIAVFDKDAVFQYVSPSLAHLTGYEGNDLIGKVCLEFIHPDDLKHTLGAFAEVVDRENKGIATEFRFRRNDGSWIYLEALGNNCLDNPAINGIIINARDITDRKRMEEQLRHSQKMEAIGTLAGGIAHDFNNLLMGIQGYISLMLLTKKSDNPDFSKLNNIQSLVQSGADLTAKLLGFARGGQYELKPTDLNELIANTSNIFGRTKKEIVIHQKYENTLWVVEIDRVQIEQVLINLFVNAWQAMPNDGGDIYVETDNVVINETDARSLNINKGNYIRVTITDTGSGMNDETRLRVFEPFFTTKEKGRGVGLGLASAYGIIKEHGGSIEVISELGHGTIFKIYIPASSKELLKETAVHGSIVKGTETILLVDDEKSVLDVCEEILVAIGYNVLAASNGEEALSTYKANKNSINLVILDMIMPGLSGGETYDALKLINPEVKVILSTGYSISDQAKKIMERGCQSLIQKPFRMDDLSQKIREVLDEK
jgi:two-component system, cell cycle sensor histidine kinase and response regulator CckA